MEKRSTKMQHPLIDPSLTPHGFGIGNTYSRTSWKSDDRGTCNGDWCAMRFWQEANRLSRVSRPAEHIIHEIMPSIRTIGRTTIGDIVFDGKLYQSSDIAVLGGIARWLGTSVGRAMLYDQLWGDERLTKTTEFLVRWRIKEHPQSEGYMLRNLLHECRKDTCGGRAYSQNCHKYYRKATEREELVLKAFLFWLGTDQGRGYLAGLDDFLKTTSRNVWQGYLQRLKFERRERMQTQNAS